MKKNINILKKNFLMIPVCIGLFLISIDCKILTALSEITHKLATLPSSKPATPAASEAVKPVTPVAPKVEIPKVVKPLVPKVEASKVVKPVVPKVVEPKVVTPVEPKAVEPKIVPSVAPKAPAPKPKSVVIEQPLASQVVGVISVKNSSKFKASWTGWKTRYKTATGEIKYKLHTLKVPHELKSAVKRKASMTLQPYTVHNLPANSYVEGVSDLMINDIPVAVDYQGSAWMPGVTDAIYITSSNGSTWTLDKKAMDKNYKQINAGIISNSKSSSTLQDSSEPVTDVTKAASVPVVLKNKKNQKKFKDIAKYSKSKSSKAFEHATKVAK